MESSTTVGDFGMVSCVTWDRLSRFLTLAASGRNFETMTGTRLHPPPTLMPIGQVTAKLFPHPLNAWYAAAWDHEVSSMGLLARTIAGPPMTLYRTSDGRPVALADACWHRLAPLSMGRLVGNDEVTSPYHGLRFNSAGRCTHMPAQDRKSTRLNSSH